METPVAIEVAVGNVEREVQRLRALDAATVRACSLNLVVVLWDNRDADAIRDAVVRVTNTHPARAILVDALDREAPAEVRSWVAYRCQPPGAGGMRVCHEEISIAVRGNAVSFLDTVVFSVMEADMPRFLWWNGCLPESPEAQRVFGHLAEQCDRLMFDSRRMTDAATDLVAMSLLSRADSDAASLGDLNWHRLTPWRHLLGQAFDAPEMRGELRQVAGGRVAWKTPYDHDSVLVPLYLGWLASSLGWKPVRCEEAGQCMFDAGGRRVTFELVRQSGDDFGLTLVEIVTPQARVTLRQVGDSMERVVEEEGRRPQISAVPAPSLDLAAVLEAELAILSHNPPYEKALQMAERLFSPTNRK
ncbi:MAG: glucose-6-phosphate dehydrogenase assembly protein OpcA [Candidatus Xenobia bacterium]